jgi:Spy/CpxP family protein refolding chaperone
LRAVVLATLATLAGLALAATPAFAQNAWLASKMTEGMCGAKAAPGANLDRLAKRLNLTDAQRATLKDLKDAAAASAASTRTALCDVKPDLTTAPSRLAFSEKVTHAQLDGMKAIEPKLQAFYASLDDQQKHAVDSGGRVGGLFGWLNR